MKVHFTHSERLLIHRIFSRLVEGEGRNRDRRRKLHRIANRFWGPAPMTNLKREEAALVFTAFGHLLQREDMTNHPNRGVMEKIVDKLVPHLQKEARIDDATGIKGPEAI
jgi:hypothetical protein